MRPSYILVPTLFIALLVILIIPMVLRSRDIAAEILPATSFRPEGNNGVNTGPVVTVKPAFPGLEEFATRVMNGDPNQVVGVYVDGRFALPIVQQPDQDQAYVSEQDGLITQFGLPNRYGSVGLLAHNYLSGRLFTDIQIGDEVVLIHGDGTGDVYLVSGTQQFQALSPNSPYSKFVDLQDDTSPVLTSASLFNQIYTGPDQLVFQTCIDAYGDPSWGRLFITADKVPSLPILITSDLVVSNN